MSQWREALAAHPELQDFNNWPRIEVDTLVPEKRRDFLTHCAIITRVLKGEPMKSVAEYFQCSAASVTQLMNRCFSLKNDTFVLTSALIPYTRVKTHERHAPLPSHDNRVGAAGSLTALFKHLPSVREKLDELILDRIKDRPEGVSLSPMDLHGKFKAMLAEHAWPTDQWPNTSQDLGRETIRLYIKKRYEELAFERRKIKERVRDEASNIASAAHERLMGRIEIDAQFIDFQGRLDIVLNDELIPLRLARAWLYCAIEVATDNILGYIVVEKKVPSQWDVLRLFAQCFRPWTPMHLTTPEFRYAPGACLATGLPEMQGLIMHEVALDNAWAHHANTIQQFVVAQQGITLHLGHPGQPKSRQWIERTFNRINQHLSHRMPSTMGSNVLDPKRESRRNSKKPPRIPHLLFYEALELELTQHQVIKQGGKLAAASPLDLLRAKRESHWVPYQPKQTRSSDRPFEWKYQLPIKSRKDSMARHVNFEGTKYPCSHLESLTPADTHLKVIADIRDIRSLKAFNLSGHFLGRIFAPKSWQSYPHSIDSRMKINKMVKYDHLQADDLLSAGLLRALKEPNKSRSIQTAFRLMTEFCGGEQRVTAIEQPEQAPTENELATPRSREASTKKFTWSIEEASHVRHDAT
jgi:hypothetical protein